MIQQQTNNQNTLSVSTENDLTDFFVMQIVAAYDAPSKAKESLRKFLKYLINHRLITFNTVYYYAIRYAFEYYFPQHEFDKAQTVATMAERFQISELQIWLVLVEHLREDNNSMNKLTRWTTEGEELVVIDNANDS